MIRAAAAAVIGGLAGAVWLALFYVTSGGLRVEFAVNPPRPISGFYAAERDNATGLTFAWMGPEAAIRLPRLDRRHEWTLTIRARTARPAQRKNPTLAIFVDGVQLHTAEVQPDFSTITMLVPPRPERRGLTLIVRSSSTFVPGGADPRQLAVMVDVIELAPNAFVLPPAETFSSAMVSGAALAAALALLGVTAASAIGGAILLTAGQGAMLAHGFGAYTDYPEIVSRLAAATAVGLLAAAVVGRWRVHPFRNTARFAIAFSAGACFLKLLVLLHPDKPIGDALFQAHRFMTVLRGNFYFTSTAPGGYAFPYAPGLYVFSMPFAPLVEREFGDMALLRIVTTVADAVAGLLLYWVAARMWTDRLAAAMAVAIYHLMPLRFGVISGGNLTNAFAESVAVGVLALIAGPAFGPSTPVVLALSITLTVAFLSHTSTFAILTLCVLLTAAVFWWRGGPALRRPALSLALALAASLFLAIAIYYAQFTETYRTEFARIGTEAKTAAPDAGGRSVLQRALAVPRYAYLYFTVPIILLAIAGAIDRWRRGSRDRLSLAVAGWGLACTLFLLLGVLTPVDMRYYLAATPAVALLAAAGASYGWQAAPHWRVLTAVLLSWAIWIAVDVWWHAAA
jgi:hypothetical protein